MGELDNRHFRQAMDAIERLDKAASESEVADIVSLAVAPFGLEYFCGGVPPSFKRQNFEACVMLRRWPQGWAEQYQRSNFHRHDPVVKHIHKQLRSSHWSDVPIPDDPTAQSIMQIAADDFRLRAGLMVPILGFDGYQAGISFAGSDIDASANAKSAVELIAIYAFNRLNYFRSAVAGPDKILTTRQKEVLTWAASGKSAWDTSRILGVSESNVNKLLASAIIRLQAANKTHAVVEAIRRKEIDM
jgi:LuxR family quorum sensing-dependent transcriptional regulator